jgi:hypothetical protein
MARDRGKAMIASRHTEYRTRMFARVVGPYLVAIAAAVILRPTEMKTMLSLFEGNPLWAWVVGDFILLLGLTVIALHPYWRGAAAIIVSLIGWGVAAKGLILVIWPRNYFSTANSAIDAVGWWQSAAVVYALAGLYLTYVGWMPKRERPASGSATAVPDDIPRAA